MSSSIDNWGKILKEHRFDKSSFDHEKMMEDFPTLHLKRKKYLIISRH